MGCSERQGQNATGLAGPPNFSEGSGYAQHGICTTQFSIILEVDP